MCKQTLVLLCSFFWLLALSESHSSQFLSHSQKSLDTQPWPTSPCMHITPIDRSYDRNQPEYIILKKAKTHKPKIKINKNPEHIPHIIFQKIKQNPETQCIQTTRSAKTVPQLNNIPNSKQRKQRKKNHRNT